MTKLMLTGMGAVIGLALVSAIVMIANAPANSHPAGDNPYEIGAAAAAPANDAGRLVLTFEPAASGIDRR